MQFIRTYSDKIHYAKNKIEEADCVLLGAGSGLSTAAGLVYDGEDWKNNFGDFIGKYSFPDLYYGGFGPFDNEEERWAYWSRMIYLERYKPGPLPLYQKLLSLLKDKDFFVLTTNVDHCFQKAGFPKDRLFYTQGDYGLFQCSVPCHQKTYDNEKVILQMLHEQKGMAIPPSLIPRCPVCGKPMSMNLRADDTFVQDEGWQAASDRYDLWLADHYEGKKIVYLEIGVGRNTPAIIKYPFQRLTSKNPEATYICINFEMDNVSLELEEQSILIKQDIALAIQDLLSV
jgi:NAD-dependent SIR2 family protein deacetylase